MAPPAIVAGQLGALEQIDRVTSLPQAIQAGSFTVDGTSAAGWKMAEPGGAFSATDVPVPGAPARRLIFAACDSQLCVVHYERGGIAHLYELLALSLQSGRWRAVWNARGPARISDLAALRAMLRDQAPAKGWSQQWVKGDF